jgi:hypothetical protein
VDYVWMFTRGDERIEIHRSPEPDTTTLTLIGDPCDRRLDFKSHDDLVVFQAAFEEHLIETGWQFTGFQPERRSEEPGLHTAAPVRDRRRVLAWRATRT